jgi:phenylacetate-CoA ligase
VLDNYGMTETGPMGMDCEARRAHPFTDLFYFEVLDERLENEVAPGEIGQLVVTSLTKRAVPLVRYVTGDRVRRFDQRCRCGRTSTLEVRGRADETLSIDGRPFDLWTLSEIVSRLPARRFWRVSRTAEGLRYVVEKERTDDAIDAELLSELGRDYGVPLEVELVPRGTLYDRTEPLSFGMTAKPIYIDPPRSADEARCH